MTTMTDSARATDDPMVAAIDPSALRSARRDFLAALEPLRPELYRYCRTLTGDGWDAEDLVQETLARAMARAAESHQRIERPIAWLVRIATNVYIDGHRRPHPVPTEVADQVAAPGTDALEVRDALREVTTLLPPQERAAVVLKDVFDLPLSEIAAMLGTSVGAVKAALHRGRGRLDRGAEPRRSARPVPDRAVVDALADAFSAYDLDRLAGLFLTDGVSEVVGMVYEVGREQIRNGSLRHTLEEETGTRYRGEVVSYEDEPGTRYRGEVVSYEDEPVVLLWGRAPDGSTEEAVEDVLRAETADGGIARLRWYFFCPETIRAVTGALGLPCRPVGYHY